VKIIVEKCVEEYRSQWSGIFLENFGFSNMENPAAEKNTDCNVNSR
jgi:hypothetical protein